MKRLDPPFIRSTIKPGYKIKKIIKESGEEETILEFDNETYYTWEVLIFQGKKGEEICPKNISPKDWKPHFIIRENGQTSVDPKDQNWRTATKEEVEYYFKCLEEGKYQRLEEFKEKIKGFTEEKKIGYVGIPYSITDRTPDGRVFKRILFNEELWTIEDIPVIKKSKPKEIVITKEEFDKEKEKIWVLN